MVAAPPPPAEPELVEQGRADGDWDETAAEAARYDRAYFDDLYDRDEDS